MQQLLPTLLVGPFSQTDCFAATSARHVTIKAEQSGLAPTVLNTMQGKKITLNVVDLLADEMESPKPFAHPTRAGPHDAAPARLTVAPDCSPEYLAPEGAQGKFRSMVEGTTVTREELGGWLA